MPPAPSHRSSTANRRIVIPQRCIQGGFDYKFETDPYNVELHGLLTEHQFTDAMSQINDKLKKARFNRTIDGALLVTGPLIVPLAIWGVRHGNQTKRRKRLLKQAMEDFMNQYPDLLMRWNRRPESILTIERRRRDEATQQQQPGEASLSNPPLATAELVSSPSEAVGNNMTVVHPVQQQSNNNPNYHSTGHPNQTAGLV